MKAFKKRQAVRSWRGPKRRKRRLKLSLRLSWPRLDLKKRLDTRKLRKLFTVRLLSGIGGTLLLASLVYLLVFSAYFTVKSVRIEGTESIQPAELEQAARNDFLAKVYGYLPGNNLLFLDERAVQERLRVQFPEIETVRIVKRFPATVSITVEEKQPALVWCRTSCYFLNAQGLAYLPFNEQDPVNQRKRFIKIFEQSVIPEESGDGSPEVSLNSGAEGEGEVLAQETGSQDAPMGTELLSPEGPAATIELAANGGSLPDILAGQTVTDESFISFALEANEYLERISKLKAVFYKTKGTKTRELIAFTDKNTRIYLDTTRPAKKQMENLGHFLDKGIGQERVDGLRYIYLKNTDRVFYK